MKTQLLSVWLSIRYGYWFAPAILAVLAIALSVAMTALDGVVQHRWIRSAGWL